MLHCTPHYRYCFRNVKNTNFLTFATFTLALASIFQGCETTPNNAAWYNPNIPPQQVAMDEAACRNMVRVNQDGIILDEGGAVGLMSIIAENNREHDIFTDCMVSKGYFLINANGLALLQNSQLTGDRANVVANAKVAASLIGHWETDAVGKVKKGHLTGTIAYDFLPDNHTVATRIANGKSYQVRGKYNITNGILVISLATTPAPEIIATESSLIGGCLMITDVNGETVSFTKGIYSGTYTIQN
jgi:hypothetical protein